MVVAPSANLRIQFTDRLILTLRLPLHQYGLLDRGLHRLQGFVRRSDYEYPPSLIAIFPEVPSEEIEPIVYVGDEGLLLRQFQSSFLEECGEQFLDRFRSQLPE